MASVPTFVVDAFDDVYSFARACVWTGSSDVGAFKSVYGDFEQLLHPDAQISKVHIRSCVLASKSNDDWQMKIDDAIDFRAAMEKHAVPFQLLRSDLHGATGVLDFVLADSIKLMDRVNTEIDAYFQDLPDQKSIDVLEQDMVAYCNHKVMPYLNQTDLELTEEGLNLAAAVMMMVDAFDENKQDATLQAWNTAADRASTTFTANVNDTALSKACCGYQGDTSRLERMAQLFHSRKGNPDAMRSTTAESIVDLLPFLLRSIYINLNSIPAEHFAFKKQIFECYKTWSVLRRVNIARNPNEDTLVEEVQQFEEFASVAINTIRLWRVSRMSHEALDDIHVFLPHFLTYMLDKGSITVNYVEPWQLSVVALSGEGDGAPAQPFVIAGAEPHFHTNKVLEAQCNLFDFNQ